MALTARVLYIKNYFVLGCTIPSDPQQEDTMNKFDIVDAIMQPHNINFSFAKGEVVACLTYPGQNTVGGIPMVLKLETSGHNFMVQPFAAGTTKEEVKARLCDQVDRLFMAIADIL